MTWEAAEATPMATPHANQWEETPSHLKGSETPGGGITPGQSTRQWAETPGHMTPGHATPGRQGATTPAIGMTPSATPSSRKNRWDETPKTDRETPGRGMGWAETPGRHAGEESTRETPGASKRKSRWDLTPAAATPSGNQTPSAATPSFTPGGTPSAFTPNQMGTPGGATPSMFTPSAVTPIGTAAAAMATPSQAQLMQMTPEQLQNWRWEREIDERNRYLTDEELDTMFPDGYKVLQPPASYQPATTPGRKITATPTPLIGPGTGFHMQTEGGIAAAGIVDFGYKILV